MKIKYIQIILFFICNFNIMISSMNKIIYITPGGLKGFYCIGVSKYIKERTKLTNYSFYGSSAGSWNALYLSLKTSRNSEVNNFLEHIYGINYTNNTSLLELQYEIKSSILSNYNTDDFELDKLNIGVSVITKFGIKQKIFNNFDNLEDAIDCCIVSSHIPLICSSRHLWLKYKGNACFDGGFFTTLKDRNNRIIKPNIYISPNMWKNKDIEKYNSMHKLNIRKLVDIGYKDASNNLHFNNK